MWVVHKHLHNCSKKAEHLSHCHQYLWHSELSTMWSYLQKGPYIRSMGARQFVIISAQGQNNFIPCKGNHFNNLGTLQYHIKDDTLSVFTTPYSTFDVISRKTVDLHSGGSSNPRALERIHQHGCRHRQRHSMAASGDSRWGIGKCALQKMT